ncbi:MAG: carboxypeptidase regulatory-like domain-containing protein [Acidobacteria bacterium]|nr:carboxypeptidase regulatory-like domain-containing protein [Acidobacteriota bacterium]
MRYLLTALVLFFCFGPAAAATLTVTKLADTNDGVCDADCSLREAIAAANSSAADDTIVFDAAVFAGSQKITLASALGQLSVAGASGTLAINGPGATRLAISGGNLVRVFNVAAGANLSLDRLTVTEGKVTGSGNGGGILNSGTLTVTRSTVSANSSDFLGGGISNSGAAARLTVAGSTISGNTASGLGVNGGGIYNSAGTLLVTNSTISNNTAAAAGSNAAGGGLYINGPGTVTNSAIFGNTVIGGDSGNGQGGGVFIVGGTSNLANTTISGNFASSTVFYGLGGGISVPAGTLNITNCTVTGNSTAGNVINSGGGIYAVGPVNIRNTIVAGNSNNSVPASNGPDVRLSFVSLGGNLIGKTDGSTSFTQPTDRTGTAAAPLDPRLGPLGLYGGLTMTFPLLAGSQAIDNGNSCVADLSCAANNPAVALASDQRGAARVGAVDIGAFEANNTLNGGAFRGRLPDALLNQSYSQTLIPDATGTTVCLTSGALPAGISGVAPCLTGLPKQDAADFAPAAPVTLAGTPTVTGNYNFTVQVTQGGNTTQINYLLPVTLVPTAAAVDVGGRVATNTGRAVANATVTLTKANGETLSVRTNSFGYYKFAGIESGQTVILTVRAKGLEFAPQLASLTDTLADLDLTAL